MTVVPEESRHQHIRSFLVWVTTYHLFHLILSSCPAPITSSNHFTIHQNLPKPRRWDLRSCTNAEIRSCHQILSSPRGGGGGAPASTKVIIAPSSQQTSDNILTKTKKTQESLQNLRRIELLTLFLLRILFFLLHPISLLLFSLTLLLSILLTILRILTLNFYFVETSRIMYGMLRASIALVLATLSGVVSPPFAVFGLLASWSLVILELTEPVLKIRYGRLMRKLRHLYGLITDPVLVETLDAILEMGRVLSERVSSTSDRGIVTRWKRLTSSIFTFGKNKTNLARQRLAEDESIRMLQTLVESSEMAQSTKRIMKRALPKSTIEWLKDQFESMKRSGVLTDITDRTVEALKDELDRAMVFVPYLEAIMKVNEEKRREKGRSKRGDSRN